MTELQGWHSALHHLKRAYKDESVVSNIATANFGDELDETMNSETKMDLVNFDESMSYRSGIPMDSDKYEIGNIQCEVGSIQDNLQFDTTMPGIIDVSSIHEDESEFNKITGSQEDGFKLDLSLLVEKPTHDIHVDLAGDMIHDNEDLSEGAGSGSESDKSSLIFNVWNEDYDGNPDPEVMHKLINAKHLPRNIDPYVLGKIRRAKIINQIRKIEDDDSSEGSCGIMFDRMCLPKFYGNDDLTDEGSYGSVGASSLVESIKETSIAGSVDSEVFQFKRPKRSPYALISDKQFIPGAPSEQLVMMLPKNKSDLLKRNLPSQRANYEADDDSSSEGRRTYVEKEMEFTLQKYDQAPHRIAARVLTGKQPEVPFFSNDTVGSSIGGSFESFVMSTEKIEDLDGCILRSRRVVGDEDSIEENRSIVSKANEGSNRQEPDGPLVEFVKIFTDPHFRLQHISPISDVIPDLKKANAAEEVAMQEPQPTSFVDSEEVDPLHELGSRSSLLVMEPSIDVSRSDHLLLDCSISEDRSSSDNEISNEFLSESNLSLQASSEDIVTEAALSDEDLSEEEDDASDGLASPKFRCISKARRVGQTVSGVGDFTTNGDTSVEGASADDPGFEIAPTASSITSKDDISLNHVGSSYSYLDQENYVGAMSMQSGLKKGKGFDESCDEFDQDEQSEQLFVERRSLVPLLPQRQIYAEIDSRSSCCDSVDPQKFAKDGSIPHDTSSEDGVEDLIEALDMTLQLQVTNTASYTTDDGEEIVIAMPVEGVMVEQPNSRYGRIIAPEEFERLCNTLEEVSEEDAEDISSLIGEVGVENVDTGGIQDQQNSIASDIYLAQVFPEGSFDTCCDVVEIDNVNELIQTVEQTPTLTEFSIKLEEEIVEQKINMKQAEEADVQTMIKDQFLTPTDRTIQDLGEEVVVEEDATAEVILESSFSPAQQEVSGPFDACCDAVEIDNVNELIQTVEQTPTLPEFSSKPEEEIVEQNICMKQAEKADVQTMDKDQFLTATDRTIQDLGEQVVVEEDATAEVILESSFSPAQQDVSVKFSSDDAIECLDGLLSNTNESESNAVNTSANADSEFFFDTMDTPSPNTEKKEACAIKGEINEEIRELDSMIAQLRNESYVEEMNPEQKKAKESTNIRELDSTICQLRDESFMTASDAGNSSIPNEKTSNSKIDDASIETTTSAPSKVTHPQKKKELKRSTSAGIPISNLASDPSNKTKTKRKKRKTSQIPKKNADPSIVDDLRSLKKAMAKKKALRPSGSGKAGRPRSRVCSTSLLDAVVQTEKTAAITKLAKRAKTRSKPVKAS